MRVASDVLGSLKSAYVDKGIAKKLDDHEALDDLDVLKLIGGVFSAGYVSKRKHLSLADPFHSFSAKEVQESINHDYSKLTPVKLAEALNETYAQSHILNKNVWQEAEFQQLMLEVAYRWQKQAKNRKVRLEFLK